MPRKYKNSKESKRFLRRVMDVFVTIQDAKGLRNQDICDKSGLGTTVTQFTNFTGIRRSERGYATEKKYVGARDQVGIVTLYDFCRALNPTNPEKQLLTVLLLAHGLELDAIESLLNQSLKDYIFTFAAADVQQHDENI